MTISAGIFVCGIDLGQVEVQKLKRLSHKTNSIIEYAKQSSNLENLYLKVRNEYYNRYRGHQSDKGSLVVTSIPDGKEVIIEGRQVGQTPYKDVFLEPSSIKISLVYSQGFGNMALSLKLNIRQLSASVNQI